MAEKFAIPAGASAQQIEIIVGALSLSLAYVIAHIVKTEDASSVDAFKREFIGALKSGDIDMSIMDDAETFDFIVPTIEKLIEFNA